MGDVRRQDDVAAQDRPHGSAGGGQLEVVRIFRLALRAGERASAVRIGIAWDFDIQPRRARDCHELRPVRDQGIFLPDLEQSGKPGQVHLIRIEDGARQGVPVIDGDVEIGRS